MQNPTPYEPEPPSQEAAPAPAAPASHGFVSYPESGPPPPPPPGFPPMQGMPGMGMQTASPPPTRSRSGVAKPVVAIVAAFIGFFVFRMLTGVSVSVPDQINGVSRITTGPLGKSADQAIDQADLNSYHAVGGLYGTPDAPDFLFIAAKGTESADEDGQALQSTADGLGSGGSIGLDLDKTTTEVRDGTTYNCAPMTGRGVTGAACLWNDGKTLGAVLWFTDKGPPTDFAVIVHDAVVG
jgi:hypothetical protein